jgi:hypothetical protein
VLEDNLAVGEQIERGRWLADVEQRYRLVDDDPGEQLAQLSERIISESAEQRNRT